MEASKKTRRSGWAAGRSPGKKPGCRCFRIAARTVRGRPQIATARLPGHGEAVAALSFEDEARLFPGLSRAETDAGGVDEEGPTAGGGWAVRWTYPAGLVPVLLDPLPGPTAVLQQNREAV